ncbi:MAG: DUF418 domain-containing protein [Legionellales bacterium]|nr:DUF418 domain-containing protein [Legionellales bacterium]
MNLTSNSPSTEQRITTIDFIRGIAVLGILLLNIQLFAMVMAAYENPTTFGDLTGFNYWVFALNYLFAKGKFITIFSMLFGASTILLSRRLEQKFNRIYSIYYRRIFFLFIIGLLHAYLFWYGDILVTYAVCGFWIIWLRHWSAKRLAWLGCMLISIGYAVEFYPALVWHSMSTEAIQEFYQFLAPSQIEIAREVAIYQGSWWQQIPHRFETVFVYQTEYLITQTFWLISGIMLLGMALFKWDVFSGNRSRTFYKKLAIIFLATGLPLTAISLYGLMANQWQVNATFLWFNGLGYFASLLVAIGYIGLMILISQSTRWSALQHKLCCVGRMAFTNYLLQTFICFILFYGQGFGLFGQVNRIGQITIVVMIWLLLIFFSTLWLHYFKYGPFEWLWRNATYLNWQPIRRD